MLPFFPELKVPVAVRGPLTVVLFDVLGLAPPLLTQTHVAVAWRPLSSATHSVRCGLALRLPARPARSQTEAKSCCLTVSGSYHPDGERCNGYRSFLSARTVTRSKVAACALRVWIQAARLSIEPRRSIIGAVPLPVLQPMLATSGQPGQDFAAWSFGH
jgi:hypothetical protein